MILIIAGLFSAAAVSLWRVVPFSVADVERASESHALYDRNGVLFQTRLSPDGEWVIPVPLEKMGKWLPAVAVGVEDKRFYSHAGVDFLAILRAAWKNIVSGKILSGASTITSQVIRLTITEKQPRRTRDFSTKLVEFVQAMKLELEMPKEKILEIYLNRAPFGGNIRGVEAAARVYFGKSAENISPGEASILIGMLIAPTIYRPDTRPEASERRRNGVIAQLEERGVFTQNQARLARAEPLPKGRFSLPFRAYHYALRLFQETALPGRIDTGLDLSVQTALEKILLDAVSSLPGNITAAGGIIDNTTNKIIAWVGNARFGQAAVHGSWVDCGLGLRSPGSALKTFAWIAAFDSGKLTPGTLLADTPIAFSGRAPRNFDLSYRGAVSARVALADSLNAPAVRVLRLAGAENVLQIMRNAGLSSLNKSSSYYGDSLILGGCDIRLSELLEAYSTVANGGERWHGSRFIIDKNDENDEGIVNMRRVFSHASAWLVSEILSDTRRMSFMTREALQFEGHKIAFKTGTSYGLRDAWTAAWTPRFTVAIWVGDPSGLGWAQLVGLNAAAPAAFKMMRRLAASAWFETPCELFKQSVCSLSGKPPTAACPSVRNEWAILDVTKILPCELHRFEGGKNILALPPELTFLSPKNDIRRADAKLEIISPINGGRYVITSEQQKIPLRSEGGHGKIYWFVNGSFAGESLPNVPLFHSFPPGNHAVSVMDVSGRTANTKVNVASITPTKDEILKFE